jgi:toxin ParE1/3/4
MIMNFSKVTVTHTVCWIREFPTRYIAIDDEVRRCVAWKFPYGILYTIEQDYILILAVMHCSREPGY